MTTTGSICESTDSGTTFNYFDSVTPDSSGNLATTYTATGLATGTTPLFYVTEAGHDTGTELVFAGQGHDTG